MVISNLKVNEKSKNMVTLLTDSHTYIAYFSSMHFKFNIGVVLGCPCSKIFHSKAGFSLMPLKLDRRSLVGVSTEFISSQVVVQTDIPTRSS